MENVRGVGCGRCGLFPLVSDTQLLPVLWVNYIYPPFSSATFHIKTIVCLIANQNMEDVRHTDVLMNVLFGDLHPYDPGCSCGVTLCIGSQTQRETEDPYRCQPFNLFCNQSSLKYSWVYCWQRAGGKVKRHKWKEMWQQTSNSLYFFDKWLQISYISYTKECLRAKPGGVSQQLATAQ